MRGFADAQHRAAVPGPAAQRAGDMAQRGGRGRLDRSRRCGAAAHPTSPAARPARGRRAGRRGRRADDGHTGARMPIGTSSRRRPQRAGHPGRPVQPGRARQQRVPPRDAASRRRASGRQRNDQRRLGPGGQHHEVGLCTSPPVRRTCRRRASTPAPRQPRCSVTPLRGAASASTASRSPQRMPTAAGAARPHQPRRGPHASSPCPRHPPAPCRGRQSRAHAGIRGQRRAATGRATGWAPGRCAPADLRHGRAASITWTAPRPGRGQRAGEPRRARTDDHDAAHRRHGQRRFRLPQARARIWAKASPRRWRGGHSLSPLLGERRW